MACSATAFSFFALDSVAATKDLQRGSPAGPGAFRDVTAAAAPSSARRSCSGCGRQPAGRCSFCTAPPGMSVCESCSPVCNGCGRSACGPCAAARFSGCPSCEFMTCDECRLQPGSVGSGGGDEHCACWCEGGRERDVGNMRFVSSERFKALTLTHPSMRESSMAAAGLRDDEDEGDCPFESAWEDSWQDLDSPGPSCGSGGGAGAVGAAAVLGHASGTPVSGGAGSRYGSFEASDGGSSIRRSLFRYGALSTRPRHMDY